MPQAVKTSVYNEPTGLLAAAAHELKTPLLIMNSIASATRSGLFGEISSSIERQLSRIEVTGGRLLTVVDGILALEKYRSGVLTVHHEPVNVASIARSVTEELDPLVTDSRQTVLLQVSSAVRPAAGDRYFIHQILFNLLHNALKYSPEGSSVIIYIRAEHGEVCASVTDQATPLSASDKRHIFSRFSPLSSRAGLPGSNGLGLYLCQNLANLLGGKLTHRSLATGNRFYLRLPSIEQMELFEEIHA